MICIRKSNEGGKFVVLRKLIVLIFIFDISALHGLFSAAGFIVLLLPLKFDWVFTFVPKQEVRTSFCGKPVAVVRC